MTTTSVQLSQEQRDTLLRSLDQYQNINSPKLAEASSARTSSSVESDAELALRLILECGQYTTYAQVSAAVQQYTKGNPLAYITNLHQFGDLTLNIRPPVYIPRVETEQWVLLLASSILSSIPTSHTRPIRILDICSGSGCIPLLLASLGKGTIHVVGADVDDRALAIARENVNKNGLGEVARFEKLDLFEDGDVKALREKVGAFDMVVSNPPYVSSSDMKEVEGKWFEGRFALQGKLKGASDTNDSTTADDDDGYSFYRRIHDIYSLFLDPDRAKEIPKLVLEVGSRQSQVVQDMYEGEGRIEVQRETERRRDIGAPKLESGDMVGTERSIWLYDHRHA